MFKNLPPEMNYHIDQYLTSEDRQIMRGVNKDMMDYYEKEQNIYVQRQAALKGDLNVLKWIISNSKSCDPKTTYYCAKGNNFECLRWCIEMGCPWNEDCVNVAAQNGNIEILEWAINRIDCPSMMDICNYAACKGYLKVIEWAILNCKRIVPRPSEYDYKNLDNLKFSINYKIISKETSRNAVINGKLPLVSWLKQIGCPFCEEIIYDAAENGHVNIIIWLIKQGFYYDETIYYSGTKGGHLNVLKFAYMKKLPFTGNLIIYANLWQYPLKNGYIDILDWLKDHDFPMISIPWEVAALNGKINVLQWLKDNMYEIDYSYILEAAVSNNINVLEWAKNNGHHIDKSVFENRFVRHNKKVINWGKMNGYLH